MCHEVCLCPSPAPCPLPWVVGCAAGGVPARNGPPAAVAAKWNFYSAGPLDGEIVFTYLGCEMKLGSNAGTFNSNEAHRACYLQEVCGDDSDVPCSSAVMLQLPCKEPGSAEPCWSLGSFWQGALPNWPCCFMPCPIALEVSMAWSNRRARACLHSCQPLHVPYSSIWETRRGNKCSHRFPKGAPEVRRPVGTWEPSLVLRQEYKSMCAQVLLLLLFCCCNPLAFL